MQLGEVGKLRLRGIVMFSEGKKQLAVNPSRYIKNVPGRFKDPKVYVNKYNVKIYTDVKNWNVLHILVANGNNFEDQV